MKINCNLIFLHILLNQGFYAMNKWFRSYLEGRGYYVSIGEHKSKWTAMTCVAEASG